MSECKSPQDIFLQSRKVGSTFRDPQDVPKNLTSSEADFKAWAKLPKITYAARPEDLYDLPGLAERMRNDPCFVEAQVAEYESQGVTYPPSFYAGLAVGGLALLFVMVKG